ncbi:MAG: TetR family transcriptional regulator [Paracoccaceae bacterium]
MAGRLAFALTGLKGSDDVTAPDGIDRAGANDNYASTSTADLVDKLGVNKFSLFAEFGSKQAL